MKAALNGVLNCSILDGWWDECYNGRNGWAIASADDDADIARRDQREATSLFGLLEREIVPLFYDRDADGVPVQWVNTMKENWRSLGPFVTATRMVRDYTSHLYEPSAAGAQLMIADGGRRGKALATWKSRVRAAWVDVKVIDVDVDTSAAHEGDIRTVRANVELGALDPSEVTVQALHGPIDSTGAFVGAPGAFTLLPSGSSAGNGAFEGECEVGEAGPYGVTVRILPHHHDLVSPMEMGLVVWSA
jgi:starch phosphorylase